MRLARSAALVMFVVGCGKSPAVDKPPGGSGSMNKTPSSKGSPATFVKGPSLTPTAKLVEWMDGQKLDGKPRLLRLPIVLPMGQIGYDISKARIGGAADALEVYANDSALGVGLADRAAPCEAQNAPSCAFLVEGYWRGKQLGGLQFDVMKAELLAADQVAATSFAEVEGESGN